MTRKSGRQIKKPAKLEDYELDKKDELFEEAQNRKLRKKRTSIAQREFRGTLNNSTGSLKARKRTLRIDNAFRQAFYNNSKENAF